MKPIKFDTMHNLHFDELIKTMKTKVTDAIHLMILEKQHQQSIKQQNKTQARKTFEKNKCKTPVMWTEMARQWIKAIE